MIAINIEMKNGSNQTNKKKEKLPDDHGGFSFSSSIKIFDPETNQVILSKRAD